MSHEGAALRLNRLAQEPSPYLRQHATNPVDWYPWGQEALERARREDRPILLSIGYSSCHWCHVMERECFQSPAIAQIMNEHFVCIKVDREERPELDHLYQTAVQIMSGQGGWPLTVFLTPDLKPFFGGTYFPPEDRWGRPGFPKVLLAVAEAYRTRRHQIEEVAEKVKEVLGTLEAGTAPAREPNPAWVHRAAVRLLTLYDPQHGGFGSAPKFPQTLWLELFLREYARSRERAWLERVAFTLRRMAEGGLYDQLGGGFHRYAVDQTWMVPHFEKMLYDNALLPPLYLAVYQATGDEFYARIARETLDYVLREMTSPEGAFYTSTDADSEGEEGKFFLWRLEEFREALQDETLAELLMAHYGVTPQGNFEGGATVLHVAARPEELAVQRGWPVGKVLSLLAQGRERLLQARQRRIPPFRDEKVLTSWNALMISALAQGAFVLEEERYLEAAERALCWLEEHMVEDGLLYHAFKDGLRRGGGELLEDYAFFIQALLDLFEVAFERSLLEKAERWAQAALERFGEEGGGFSLASPRPDLVVLPRNGGDSSLPSPVAAMVRNLIRLDLLLDRPEFRERAMLTLRCYAGEMEQNPLGCAGLLCALDFVAAPPKELVLLAPREDPTAKEWLRRLARCYLPNKLLLWCDPHRWPEAQRPPLLRGRSPSQGQPTAFVCQNYTCSLPLTRWEELEPYLLGP